LREVGSSIPRQLTGQIVTHNPQEMQVRWFITGLTQSERFTRSASAPSGLFTAP
jgi:hypothetical protein